MLERLAPQVGAMMISANRHLDDYRAFGVPVLVDERADFAGPLAGLLSGLAACRTPWLATTPCDAPGFPPDLVARLASTVEARRASIAIASTNTAQGPRLQPVFALVHASLQTNLRAFVEAGGSRVREWMQRHSCLEVAFEDEAAFANLNTLDDLRSDTGHA